jgi:hypothetical protein
MYVLVYMCRERASLREGEGLLADIGDTIYGIGKSIRTAFNLTLEFLIIFFNRVMMTCGIGLKSTFNGSNCGSCLARFFK